MFHLNFHIVTVVMSTKPPPYAFVKRGAKTLQCQLVAQSAVILNRRVTFRTCCFRRGKVSSLKKDN